MRWSVQLPFAVALVAVTSIPALALTSPRHTRASEVNAEPIPTVSPLKLELEPNVLALHARPEGTPLELTLPGWTGPREVTGRTADASVVKSPETGAAVRPRRLRSHEVSPALVAVANGLIQKYHERPIGTEFPVVVSKRRYVAKLEVHYHPVGGEIKPWGNHPGISLFAID